MWTLVLTENHWWFVKAPSLEAEWYVRERDPSRHRTTEGGFQTLAEATHGLRRLYAETMGPLTRAKNGTMYRLLSEDRLAVYARVRIVEEVAIEKTNVGEFSQKEGVKHET